MAETPQGFDYDRLIGMRGQIDRQSSAAPVDGGVRNLAPSVDEIDARFRILAGLAIDLLIEQFPRPLADAASSPFYQYLAQANPGLVSSLTGR